MMANMRTTTIIKRLRKLGLARLAAKVDDGTITKEELADRLRDLDVEEADDLADEIAPPDDDDDDDDDDPDPTGPTPKDDHWYTKTRGRKSDDK